MDKLEGERTRPAVRVFKNPLEAKTLLNWAAWGCEPLGSQRDISKRCGLTQGHLSKVLTGNVDVTRKTFEKLLRGFRLERYEQLCGKSAEEILAALLNETAATRSVQKAGAA